MKNLVFYLFWAAFQKQGKPFCGKNLIWFMRICCLCVLIRGLRNFEAPFGKGFNCCGAKLPLRCADSRFAKPRNSLQRETSCHFLRCAKSNAKSTRGEALRPTIQSSAGKDFVKLSGGSYRNRFCLQNGGVKALNRCEWVAVVLTQD